MDFVKEQIRYEGSAEIYDLRSRYEKVPSPEIVIIVDALKTIGVIEAE